MNLIPAIRFAISISNGFLSCAWLFFDFLQRKNDRGSEITYEFSVFRRKNSAANVWNIHSVFPSKMIYNSFQETIFLYIYLLFTGKSSIVDAILKQTGRIEYFLSYPMMLFAYKNWEEESSGTNIDGWKME